MKLPLDTRTSRPLEEGPAAGGELGVREGEVWSHCEMEHLRANVCFLLTIQNTFSARGRGSWE